MVVPVTALMLIWACYPSSSGHCVALLIFLNVPLALSGGILALWLQGAATQHLGHHRFIALRHCRPERGRPSAISVSWKQRAVPHRKQSSREQRIA